MKSIVTVRLVENLARELSEISEALGQSRSEIVRNALRRQLSVLSFEELREHVMPFAEARGDRTDTNLSRTCRESVEACFCPTGQSIPNV